MEIMELRSSLINLLSGILGTYKFPDRTTDSAISILPHKTHGWNFPPSGTEVSGIEIIIVRPPPAIKELLGGRQKKYEWALTLKQWDGKGNLLEAIEKITDGLDYLLTSPRLIPPNPALGSLESAKLEIIEYFYEADNA